uniref:Xanthosine methyltransferase n=1 Tax=Coffea canephora TaxID=49390 RepID=UPI0000F586E3|nr:xanthosine methyltransferase [Coffea canephora]2EG5_A Chain A, Xanthosine methyltransferase [Coffea canephora]2EG5_C Chain C, Xanthosine methyltransferase [Coffea canephora]2EG5_E Chain E, Xanthosine methyltransferase [Coffea canephora]2EG5_G Chain G, Xanthosine methyltransferase [Coffea canephora]
MELQEVLRMNGGEGDTSYAKNSAYNQLVLAKVKPVLEQCVRELLRANLPNINKCIKVADLGCASGPNTLLTVRDIVQSIDKVGQEKKNELERPTIQIFLNDLFPNDFNSVFKLLPSFYRKLEKENGRKIGSCLIGAMPGSFYSRLFPEESMHFLHSCYCLQWLSQVPSGLVTELGIGTNKGSIYSSKASRLPVQKAYLDQFTKDFTTFLRIHSEELFSHGRMLLTCICKGVELDARNAIDLLEMAINDLVVEGHLEEEKLDSFNLPVYIPSAEEVKCIVEEEGSFEILYLETFKVLYDAGFSIDDEHIKAEYVASSVRAVYEPILASHFGEAIIPDIFHRFAKHAAKVLPLGKGFYNNLIISLAKKPEKSDM